jgi:hypothetical protein
MTIACYITKSRPIPPATILLRNFPGESKLISPEGVSKKLELDPEIQIRNSDNWAQDPRTKKVRDHKHIVSNICLLLPSMHITATLLCYKNFSYCLLRHFFRAFLVDE